MSEMCFPFSHFPVMLAKVEKFEKLIGGVSFVLILSNLIVSCFYCGKNCGQKKSSELVWPGCCFSVFVRKPA